MKLINDELVLNKYNLETALLHVAFTVECLVKENKDLQKANLTDVFFDSIEITKFLNDINSEDIEGVFIPIHVAKGSK